MRKPAKKTAIVKTQYGSFKAVFESEPDMGGFVATALTVQGAVSWGKNISEAKKMIADAIEGIIEVRGLSDAVAQGYMRFTARAKKVPHLA
ncbi:MAG TPA: hypothetical protein VI957_03625 [Candidatus Paceibacterota bacterium]